MQTCLLIIQQKITNAKTKDDKLVQKECIMTTIEYFRLQAKNLHKDFKTQKSYFDPAYGRDLYAYQPKFFDVDSLFLDFDVDEDNFTLMNAQHYIARLAGFRKWTDISKASPSALELSKLLFENMHKVSVLDWDIYISVEEDDKGFLFDDELKLDIFKMIFAEADSHQSRGTDYRLEREKENLPNENKVVNTRKKKMKNRASVEISALPLNANDTREFIKVANSSFERVFDRIEPENPELTRSLWDAGKYINEDVLTPDRLPIDRAEALSIIDTFMMGYIIQLAVEADEIAASSE